DSSADDGDTIRNTACVTGGPCDSDTTTITEDVGSCEDLTISIEADEDEIEPDEEFEFEITVRNPTSTDIEDADISLNISGEDVEIKSVSNGGDEEDDDRVDWENMDIDAGESITLRVKVEVDEDADDGDEIRGTARTCDDSDSVEVEVEEDDDDEDIRVTINDNPDPIDVCHDDLEYEIRLTNTRNSNKTVDVIALLDSSADYRSSSDGGREKGRSRVEWDNVKISRNSNRTLRLKVRVEGGTRDGDTLRLRVGVSDGDDDTEVTRVRNRGCGPVDEPADLAIDKTANTTEALAGSAVSYTITIRNTGGSDVPNAVLTDDYPENYINITDTGGASDAGGRLSWNLGTLKANSTTVVRYNARLKSGVTKGTSIRNTATVRSGTITRTDDHVIVVPTPPQTGLGGFINSLTKSDSYLSDSSNTASDTSRMVAVRPQKRTATSTTSTTTASLPIIIWITTMVTGLGMGGVFGKRFLF
ncbi:MAG: DUF11 domain-containing protein, partial [Candidatus Peribacteraceae bacterium]|nr:DUF11 domain-containing protein [Candidatus Peribacteraceae bacterium]